MHDCRAKRESGGVKYTRPLEKKMSKCKCGDKFSLPDQVVLSAIVDGRLSFRQALATEAEHFWKE